MSCHLFGDEMEKGEIPADFQLVGNMVQDVCYNNAKSYFGWE
ncbi:glucuronate isomerase [Chitinophaga eiseniae]|uniref:Glucuronate isomerase n=1 Tax=Chitinophaga eiseniae TaxID=634771 RepID=A0A847SVM7_9BACT|nr:glucuronate isomerase [Chitinophaga eiseniae]